MQLSKQECKSRIKFIQEHHYNKFEQKYLDEAKYNLGLSYKEIYHKAQNGFTYIFMAVISLYRTNRSISKISMSAKQLTECMAALGQVLFDDDYCYYNTIKEKI